jgi:hypothetical protein
VANEYKTEGVILINNSKEIGTKERQRFTLGHEIGHFMIPHHGHEMSCSISDELVNFLYCVGFVVVINCYFRTQTIF